MILTGKRLLITGVITSDSIAYAVADRARTLGAEVVLTSFGRARSLTERAARQLGGDIEVLELDVRRREDLDALRAGLQQRWGALDGVLHAIAYAPPGALGDQFLATSPGDAAEAFTVSAASLQALTAALLPLLRAAGLSSVVGLHFEDQLQERSYGWMGVAKTAMTAVSRYLTRDVGADGVRVNLVSAGPLVTVAAGQLEGFEHTGRSWSASAPLGWDVRDAGPVADAVCFLLSDMARAISGEVLHVDGGVHAVGYTALAKEH